VLEISFPEYDPRPQVETPFLGVEPQVVREFFPRWVGLDGFDRFLGAGCLGRVGRNDEQNREDQNCVHASPGC
jgi:hypothetical protein